MQLLTNCGENSYKTVVKKLNNSPNLLKVNSFKGIFLQIFTSSGGEAVRLQNILLLVIYIKRTLPARGVLRDIVFKATVFCSVTLIMFLFCYKDTSLNFCIFRGLKIYCSYGQDCNLMFVVKARVAFEIVEMTRFLNYISSYSFALI